MKQYLASLLVVIFALCTVPSLSVADAAAPPIQYAEDHELTPYSFESIQDIQIPKTSYIPATWRPYNQPISDVISDIRRNGTILCTNA